jgi:hypothetical protein
MATTGISHLSSDAVLFVADFFDRFRSHSDEWKKLGDSKARS